MADSDEIRACVAIGIGDLYAVRSNHGAPPYLVACTVDGHWVCSCPANHPELRARGRWCRPIREAIELRSPWQPLPTESEQGGN